MKIPSIILGMVLFGLIGLLPLIIIIYFNLPYIIFSYLSFSGMSLFYKSFIFSLSIMLPLTVWLFSILFGATIGKKLEDWLNEKS